MEKVGNDFYNQLLKSDNPEKMFLEKYDQDYTWRMGYGFYGLSLDPKAGTLTYTLGDSCE